MGRTGVVIVAGGRGVRLGMGPKGLIELDGETLIARLHRRAREAGLHQVVAVLPPDVECPVEGLAFTTNEAPESGPLGSVLRGLAHLEASGDLMGLLVWPVDHPFVDSEQIVALAREASAAKADWARIVPTWEGRRGHPIWVCRAGIEALRAVDDATRSTLREVLGAAGEVHELAATSDGVLTNLNAPDDLSRARVELRPTRE